MFMIAFIYDEMLKDKQMAKESYQKFLEKYPKDEDPNEKMSESARMMLQMLEENRSIEDIIKGTQKDTIKTAGEIEDKKAGEKDKQPEVKDTETPKDQNAPDDGTIPPGETKEKKAPSN
jgi:hypothetical protein